MERDSGVVLATEKYGSAESWKYFAKDGVMERRRDGSEGESRGNSVVGVFKVRMHSHTTHPRWLFIPVWHLYICSISECLPAPRLPGECQWRLPAVPVLGYCAGTGGDTPQSLRSLSSASNWNSPSQSPQAFSSSLSGTLATQASLKGVGVGNQEATVAAATVTWLLRGDPFKKNSRKFIMHD